MFAATFALMLLAQAGSQAPGSPGPARPAEDPDQVICRAPQAMLGSRVAQRRTCKTRAEWRAFEEDRAQLRRDIQNSGRQPGTQ